MEISATGECGIVGPTYARLTQSFAPAEILTQPAGQMVGNYVTLNYNDLFSNCTSRNPNQSYQMPACATQLWGTANQIGGLESSSCRTEIASIEAEEVLEQSHCYPSIYYPTTKLQEAIPAWTTCIAPKFEPVFDPPRTLVVAAAMVPTPTSDIRQSQAAAPASTVDPPAAFKTPPPIQPTIATGSGNDPPGKDPPANDPPANNPPANNPPAAKPSASIPAENDPSANEHSGNGWPPDDPPNDSPSAQEHSDDPSEYSRPSFAVPIPDGHTLSGFIINPSSVVVAGSTIAAGASAVQVQGHQVSMDPVASNVVVDGQAHALPTAASLPPSPLYDDSILTPFSTTANGHNIEAVPTSGIVLVDGQSITRGAGSITVANTPVALHANGDLVLGTSTIQGVLPSLTNLPMVFTAAGEAATVLSNGIAIAGTILAPNAPAITVAGMSFSVGTNGLVVGTSTIPIPTPAPLAVYTAAGQAMSILANGDIIMSGTTLVPNAPGITIAGTPISLGTNGLVVGTSTVALPSSPSTSSVVIGGQTISVSLGTNEVAIAGTTLQLGQTAITISGTPVSLGASGLVIGTSIIPLSSATSTGGVGGYIFSGFNGGLGSPSATTPVAFLGGGAKLASRWSALGIAIIVVLHVC